MDNYRIASPERDLYMKKVSSLSFIFPAFNEEANVESILFKAQRILPEVAYRWEIVPVNDGSRDGTASVFSRFEAEDPDHVHPVHHNVNSGYGSAIRTGFKNARYDLIFYTDADQQFDLEELTLLIDKIDEGDVVVGFRKKRCDPLIRKVNTFLWNTFVRAIFGFNVKDVNCGFKLVKRKVIEKIKLSSNGAVISTELLAKSIRAGFRLVEVGVTHYPRTAGKPTGANLKVIGCAFQELFALYKEMVR